MAVTSIDYQYKVVRFDSCATRRREDSGIELQVALRVSAIMRVLPCWLACP